ncbi:MAG: hypothetical protein JNM02_15245 [Anaerolineales bacterium]|nr:hypothetical protein [Anaerolineales bacterium]
MTTLTINLSDERIKKLQELAERFHVAPEDLVRVSLEDLLTRPMDDFQKIVEYILNKNADLYKKLS